MSWIFDNVPVWVWLLILGGGGGALLAFVPGAFAILASVWTMLPPKVRWLLGAIAAGVGLYLGGRYRGARNERDKQKELNQKATHTAKEVKHEFERKTSREVDEYLDKHKDFRD